MAGLCKVIVIGNLGRDPEKRYTQDGRPVTRFSVAATTRRRERDGEWADHTEWFSVTVFGRQAETLAERVNKGTRVYVEGRLESRQYESQNGNKGFSLDVVANEVVVLDTRQRDGNGDFGQGAGEFEAATSGRSFQPRGGTPAQEDAADLEDLPF
jgi:single-strand DNA-binding protein